MPYRFVSWSNNNTTSSGVINNLYAHVKRDKKPSMKRNGNIIHALRNNPTEIPVRCGVRACMNKYLNNIFAECRQTKHFFLSLSLFLVLFIYYCIFQWAYVESLVGVLVHYEFNWNESFYILVKQLNGRNHRVLKNICWVLFNISIDDWFVLDVDRLVVWLLATPPTLCHELLYCIRAFIDTVYSVGFHK